MFNMVNASGHLGNGSPHMRIQNATDEIRQATDRLGIRASLIRLLGHPEGEARYHAALDRFVASGDRRWWWEDFRKPGRSTKFDCGDGWKHIADRVPDPKESIWLIAEEDSLPHYPVLETTPEVASLIIGECYAFEYHLVAKDLSWQLCETHHNTVCAIGSVVESRLELRTKASATSTDHSKLQQSIHLGHHTTARLFRGLPLCC